MNNPIENSVTHDLAWFRDNVQLWAGDNQFANLMIKEAILRFQTKLAELSDRTGLTVDASPQFTVFDYDDCPGHVVEVYEKADPDETGPTWKWDHWEEGSGDVTELYLGDPNADAIPYDTRKKALIIATRDNTFYLIPAALVSADNPTLVDEA